jgi:signal transduction histidine kinase
MERFIHSLKVFWRSERLLQTQDLRLNIKKVLLSALAGLVGLFGLVMLSLAVFFALSPLWGAALAALTIAGVDLLLAVLLIAWSGSLKPPAEAEMVREVRDMAIGDMEHEIALADAELKALKGEAQRFLRNPLDALLPGVIAPLLTGAAKGLKARKDS